MQKQIYILAHDVARKRAAQACMQAPDGYVVTIQEPKRSIEENSLLHALITQISKTQEWAGKKHDVETWKRLLVAAWCRVHGSAVEILPALDGHGVDIIPVRTSKLTKKECADLIEYIFSWGADQGIEWNYAFGSEHGVAWSKKYI
ncbi:NinB protein [Nitrosomonas sp. PY1]|uniref:recombination protein NinB n=1 Tax=Nitrosomonas sp. PY1 TaxID=1803906 RepID=UPI001FC7CB7D|nr:recombination protein NinB [Nitrosomonas sp. PY1]GKS68977.1 NinB protein [Nitrosomonas sp. PY1]